MLDIISSKTPTASVYAERVAGGRYITIDIDRLKSARFGLNIADVQSFIASSVGGTNLTTSIEGLERYPVQVRFPQDYRDSPEQLRRLSFVTPGGAHIQLGDITTIKIEDSPPGI